MTKAEREAIRLAADCLAANPAGMDYHKLLLRSVSVSIALAELLRLDAAARSREKRKP
jgi:hypothetical protein